MDAIIGVLPAHFCTRFEAFLPVLKTLISFLSLSGPFHLSVSLKARVQKHV